MWFWGTRGLPKKISVTQTHSQHTHTPSYPRHTHKAKGNPEIGDNVTNTQGKAMPREGNRGQLCPQNALERANTSPVLFKLLSFCFCFWNQKNPNTKTQDVHLPRRQYSSLYYFRGLEGYSGMVQWRILARWLSLPGAQPHLHKLHVSGAPRSCAVWNMKVIINPPCCTNQHRQSIHIPWVSQLPLELPA